MQDHKIMQHASQSQQDMRASNLFYCFIILLVSVRDSVAFSPPRKGSVINPPSFPRREHELHSSTVDIDRESTNRTTNERQSNLLILKDILPISLFTISCLSGALLVSTYEDYDVTHVRPNPSTLRRPTTTTKRWGYLGAATKGMGWGVSDRMMGQSTTAKVNEFGDWYGESATTLQWKPSYNEIMLRHRLERVPRWTDEEGSSSVESTHALRKEKTQQAVLNLYKSIDELDELKLMADNYQWDDIKDVLNPNNKQGILRNALEYSMDVIKSYPLSRNGLGEKGDELSTVVGFDWGSCAWRHCGAKADGQEALAELYSSVGMLEPFECRFVLDIIERSIRDVLEVIPTELRPHKDGVPIQVKPYVPHVSQADLDIEGSGLDAEYTQILSDLRVNLAD